MIYQGELVRGSPSSRFKFRPTPSLRSIEEKYDISGIVVRYRWMAVKLRAPCVAKAVEHWVPAPPNAYMAVDPW